VGSAGPWSARKRKARQARSALGWGLLCYAAGLLACNLLLDYRLPEARDPAYGHRLARLKERLREAPGRPVVLLLGSSRTEQGFRAEVLPALRTASGQAPLLFNFAHPAGSQLTHLMNLRRLLAEGIRPDWLVVEIIPTAWHQDAVDNEVWGFNFHTVGAADLGLLTDYIPTRDLYRRWLLLRLNAWYNYRFHLLRLGHNDLDRLGWPVSVRRTIQPDERRRAYEWNLNICRPYFQDFHITPFTDRTVRAFLDLCREQGIRVAIFHAPEAVPFQELYAGGPRSLIDTYLAEVSRAYDVPVIDARGWLPDEDFWDSHHVLARGADAFTERLAREAILPLLNGSTPVSGPPVSPTPGR
jgi:Protein of unknown function (DUF1574)